MRRACTGGIASPSHDSTGGRPSSPTAPLLPSMAACYCGRAARAGVGLPTLPCEPAVGRRRRRRGGPVGSARSPRVSSAPLGGCTAPRGRQSCGERWWGRARVGFAAEWVEGASGWLDRGVERRSQCWCSQRKAAGACQACCSARASASLSSLVLHRNRRFPSVPRPPGTCEHRRHVHKAPDWQRAPSQPGQPAYDDRQQVRAASSHRTCTLSRRRLPAPPCVACAPAAAHTCRPPAVATATQPL